MGTWLGHGDNLGATAEVFCGGTELDGMASQLTNSPQCLCYLSTSPKGLLYYLCVCLSGSSRSQGQHHSMTTVFLSD